MNRFKSNTVLAALGLVGLAAYQLTSGDFAHGIQSALAALAAFGVHGSLTDHGGAVRQLLDSLLGPADPDQTKS